MDWTLELIVVPVSDVDRAKAFYATGGVPLDVDHSAGDGLPRRADEPAGVGLLDRPDERNQQMAPGSLHGLHLCVTDIDAARAELVGRGVDASEIFHFGEGGQMAGPDPERAELQHVPLLPRSRRKHVAGPGGQARLGLTRVRGAASTRSVTVDRAGRSHRRSPAARPRSPR